MSLPGVKRNMHTEVVLRPRITEKAAILAEKNIYVFEVSQNANAYTIKTAIREMYKVSAIKVNVTTIQSKKVVSRGKMGVKKGGRKAYIQLKAGDKIEFV